MNTTMDTLLNGKILLEQPQEGYRVAIDPIFLAASIPAHSGETILDIGTGAGAALLCLAHRIADVRVIGLEIQQELGRLAAKNVRANSMQDRCEIIIGNLLKLPPRLAAGSFHHVMANPPYFEEKRSSPPKINNKRLSNIESEATLSDWINFAYLMVRPKGSVTFIYPAERMDELLALMHQKFGEIVIYPLWPMSGREAKRIIVRGRKNVQGPTRLSHGLVLHEPNGKITLNVDTILRQGLSLEL